jgi:hypothetical protein
MLMTYYRGEQPVQEAQAKKSKAKEIFQDAKFNLHKWQSNESELDAEKMNYHMPNSSWELHHQKLSYWAFPGTKRMTP